MEQKIAGAAAIAIVTALGSYVLTCAGRPFWGLLIAIVAILSGLFGLLRSASPRVKGGVLSIVSMVLGVIGAIFGILGLFFEGAALLAGTR